MREAKIKKILQESSGVVQTIIRRECKKLGKITEEIIAVLNNSGKVILFGNGGSAADAQHIAAELVGRFKKDRPALAAIALTTNTSIVTALANDYGYDCVFKRQLEALGKKQDLAFAISTSGRAKNVIEGIKQAKKMKMRTIAFTGGDGGALAKICDIAFIVPSFNTPHIQEAHIACGHAICALVEEEIFGSE